MTVIQEKQPIPKQYWSHLFQCKGPKSNEPEQKQECVVLKSTQTPDPAG